MKILHLASEYPPQKVFGLGRFVHDLAAEQARQGHEVHIVTNSIGGRDHEIVDRGVHVHRVEAPPPPKPADGGATVTQFNTQIIERVFRDDVCPDADVVNAHDWLTFLAARVVARRLGATLAVTVHDVVTGKRFGKLDNEAKYVGNIEHWMCHEADRVICVSGYIRNEVIRAYGAPRDKAFAIHNAVSEENFPEPHPKLLARFRRVLAQENERIVLYVGRLDSEKGVDVLLRAFAGLLRSGQNAKLVLAGKGELRAKLEKLTADLGVQRRVVFAGYAVGEVLSYIYHSADVLAVPSLYEPFGIVALEGMICGLPVVASATGGLTEIIQDGRSGRLVPPGDVSALSSALEQSLSDPAVRARLARTGQKRVRELYTWRRVAQAVDCVYQPKPVQGIPATPRGPTCLLVDARLAQGYAGTAVYTRQVVRALARRPDLALALLGTEKQLQGLEGHCGRVVDPGGSRLLDGEWEQDSLARSIDQSGADVLFSPAGFCPLRRSMPAVVVAHDLAFEHRPDFYRAPGLLEYLKTWLPRSLRGAEAVAAVSEHTRRDVLLTYGLPQEQVSTVYPGPGLLGESAPPAGRAARFTHVLTVSSGGPNKRLDLAVRVWAALAAGLRDRLPSLVIVGDPGEPTQSAALLAEELGVSEHVRFAGSVSDADLVELYRKAYFYLHTSEWEGFGLPLAEAMALGVPVLAGAAAAVAEVVADGGQVVPIGDVSSFADAARSLICDRAANAHWAAAARARGHAFSWKRTAEQIADLAAWLADRAPTRPSVRMFDTKRALARLGFPPTPKPRPEPRPRTPVSSVGGVSVCLIVYNEPTLIGHWLDYYYDQADELVLVYGRVKGYPEVPEDPTLGHIRGYSDPSGKVTLISRSVWPDKMAMQNAYLAAAAGDIILRPDCDEFIDDLDGVVNQMRRDALPAAALRWQTYYCDTSRVIEGGRFDVWPMRAFRKMEGFHFRRHFDELSDGRGVRLAPANAPRVDAVLHHFGYAKPLSEMRAKHLYYRWRGDAAHQDAGLFQNGFPKHLGDGVRVVPFDPQRHARPRPESLANELKRTP